ncbi:MAG: tetratricopeptide repeat protein [Endomicrobiales bacterium]|nr:tetratricopeptide repeat protein [Endomicrobiales bacterium]
MGKKETYKIMCLGESTTANQYPNFLKEAIDSKNTGLEFVIIDKGVPGTNTNMILENLHNNIEEYSPNMIIAMMGINDCRWKELYLEDISESRTFSYKRLQIYKLIRILKSHIVNKNDEIRKNNLTEDILNGMETVEKIKLKDSGREEKNIMMKEDVENERLYIRSGNYHKEKKEYKKAEEYYAKAMEINPGNEEIYIKLADCYISREKYKKAEENYKRATEINQKNEWGYVGLGNCYKALREYQKAKESYVKALKINPKNEESYISLGSYYNRLENFWEAEKVFRKGIEANPQNERIYIWLGDCLRGQSKYKEAKNSYNEAIQINPKNENSYIGLGNAYKEQKEYKKAEDNYKEVIRINPTNENGYICLAVLYAEQGKYEQAEEYYEIAKKINPKNETIYMGLGNLCSNKQKYNKASENYRKTIEINPHWLDAYLNLAKCYFKEKEINKDKINELIDLINSNYIGNEGRFCYDKLTISIIYNLLYNLYNRIGKSDIALKYFNLAKAIRLNNYNILTKSNYLKLKEITQKKKIKLVCVQYPMLPVGILKSMLDNSDEVIYVDNERIFRDAVAREGYSEYFDDIFGGDFGHCTDKGNKLLAQNIADTVFKEYFSK